MESFKVRSFLSFLVVALSLVSISHAQQAKPDADSSTSASNPTSSTKTHVVLKVGNQKVTEEEFESRIDALEPQGGDPDSGGASIKSKRSLGDDYASVLMLSQQALADHLDDSPDIRDQIEVARLQVLSDAEFAKLKKEAEPTDEEIRAYYTSHASDYDYAMVRRLFIWKKRDGDKSSATLTSQEAKAHAQAVQHELGSGVAASSVAENFKKSENGLLDVEPITMTLGESAKMDKVFQLKESEWVEIEDTPDALLEAQLVKRVRRSQDEVRSLIQQRLQAQKLQARLNDLKSKSGIWMDNEYFATAGATKGKAVVSSKTNLPQATVNEQKEDKNDDHQ